MAGKRSGGRGRPLKDETMDTLAVRLPPDLIRQVDAYVMKLKEGLPLINLTRADALRQLIAMGLEAERKRLGRR